MKKSKIYCDMCMIALDGHTANPFIRLAVSTILKPTIRNIVKYRFYAAELYQRTLMVKSYQMTPLIVYVSSKIFGVKILVRSILRYTVETCILDCM